MSYNQMSMKEKIIVLFFQLDKINFKWENVTVSALHTKLVAKIVVKSL